MIALRISRLQELDDNLASVPQMLSRNYVIVCKIGSHTVSTSE